MTETYYKDHWVDIETDRFEHYLEMFKWSESSRIFLEAANIVAGDKVVEIGCGPGFTSCELAAWVGQDGHIDGVDVNSDFIQFGNTLVKQGKLKDIVNFHCVSGSNLPFSDLSRDCVIAKNVLLYVDDPLDSINESHRILVDGGRLHVVEGDWGLLFAEPVPAELWRAFIEAAGIAFRTPMIGRKLYGLARRSGFKEVSVSTISNIDTTGRLLPMVRNLCSYARKSQRIEEKKIDEVLKTCEEAAESNELMICSPQFIVTAYK